MGLTFKTYLLDGPLMTTTERRQAVLVRMAATLTRLEAYLCDDDARRVLLREGYPGLDVGLLYQEARALAMQDVVAREISQP